MFTSITSGHSQSSILWSESSGTAGTVQKTYCATDLIGNIYMASSVNGNGLDFRIVSWRPDSVLRWTYTYDGSSNSDDVVAGIVVDSAFGVYVCGTTKESGNDDITLIAPDSAGQHRFTRHFDRSGGQSDLSSGIVEAGNNIYLCGSGYFAPTGYDYTVLKYDKTGLFLWSKHVNGSGNGDDFCNAIDVDHNENVFVTGKAVVAGGTTDVLTASWSSSGIFAWSSYYGFKPGQNDVGTTLTADANGQVYVTGQSFVSSSNSDLVVVKYLSSNGNQKWAARYGGTYSGHDNPSAILAASDNSVYVTGSTQTGTSNIDFVTIHYRPSGHVAWMQVYDGPVNGVDESRAILEDGDDVVVSGRSMGTKNFDATTISYKKQNGSINWTIRYDAAFGEAEDVVSLAKDEMGNVMVGCYSECGLLTVQPELVKIHQKEKNDIALERNLRVLAVGFSALASDTVFKRIIWYNILRGYDDSIYLMYADQLRNLGDGGGLSATASMNDEISNYMEWNPTFNWAVIASKQMWVSAGKVYPLIGIPKLYQFDKDQFITAPTNVGFTHTQSDYPIGCVTCENNALESSELESKAAWIFFINIPPFVYWPDNVVKPIINCFLGTVYHSNNPCEVCPVIPTPSYSYGSGHSPGNHEIGIWLELDPSQLCGSVLDGNSTDGLTSSSLTSNYYGIIKALPGGVYWRRTNPQGNDIILHKSIVPHITDEQGSYPDPSTNMRQAGNKMTMCSQSSLFHDYGESGRYHLDFGGIYEVTRPDIIGTAPMYFYFSPFVNHTYVQGPDMNLNYYGDVGAGVCQQSGSITYLPTPTIANCLFVNVFTSSFGIPNSEIYFVNPDLNFLTSFWNDNVITVGFAANGATHMNYVDFFANFSNSTCDPDELLHQANICSLGCINSTSPYLGDGYETSKSLSQTYVPGNTFLVHVQAKFYNGETINECQYITLNQNISNVTMATVMIRGNINDYSATPINYKVDIYEAN